MSATRDPDHILHLWLEEGPTVLPAPTVRAIEVATRATAQRRPAIRLPWRSDPMPFPYKVLGAAAVLAVVLVGGALLLGPRGDQSNVGGSSPSPTPPATLVPSPTPTASGVDPLDTATWTTYVSQRYGFSIAHPASWEERPSDHVWALPTDGADWMNSAAEVFVDTTNSIRVSVWSVAVEPGTTFEAWLEVFCTTNGNSPCTDIRARSVAVTIDGHPGIRPSFDKDTQAFFLIDNRIYGVAIWRNDDDPSVAKFSGGRMLLDALLSTMRLLPGGPVPAASSTAPS